MAEKTPPVKVYELRCVRNCNRKLVNGSLVEGVTFYKTGMDLEDVRMACPHCGSNMNKKLSRV